MQRPACRGRATCRFLPWPGPHRRSQTWSTTPRRGVALSPRIRSSPPVPRARPACPLRPGRSTTSIRRRARCRPAGVRRRRCRSRRPSSGPLPGRGRASVPARAAARAPGRSLRTPAPCARRIAARPGGGHLRPEAPHHAGDVRAQEAVPEREQRVALALRRVQRPDGAHDAHPGQDIDVRAEAARVLGLSDAAGDLAQLRAAVGDRGHDAGVALHALDLGLQQERGLVDQRRGGRQQELDHVVLEARVRVAEPQVVGGPAEDRVGGDLLVGRAGREEARGVAQRQRLDLHGHGLAPVERVLLGEEGFHPRDRGAARDQVQAAGVGRAGVPELLDHRRQGGVAVGEAGELVQRGGEPLPAGAEAP